jgi:hypothetical protein
VQNHGPWQNQNLRKILLTTHTAKVINNTQDNRKEQKMEEASKNNNKKEKVNKLKEIKYATIQEALNRPNKELIQNHNSAGGCWWRCSRSNDYTTECYAKTAKNGNGFEKPRISSQNTRNNK